MSHFPQISCSAADACPPFWGASQQDCIKSQKRQQKIGDIALFPPGRKTRKLYILGHGSQIIFMARTCSPFLSCARTQKGGNHSVTAYGAAVWRPVVTCGAPAAPHKAAFAEAWLSKPVKHGRIVFGKCQEDLPRVQRPEEGQEGQEAGGCL